MRNTHSRKGFTIIELMAVLAILALLTATVVPVGIHMIRSGEETKNGNIARSLFVVMQNVLTDMKTSGRLDELAAYEPDRGGDLVGGILNESPTGNVRGLMPAVAGVENIGGDSLYYMMLRETGEDDGDLLRLLEPYVTDKSLLSHSILVELNPRTGMVGAVFYSDTLAAFTYGGEDNTAPENAQNPDNRSTTYQRGFYGVATTGIVADPASQLPLRLIDGGHWKADTTTSAVIPDTLYAEVDTAADPQGLYTLELTDRTGQPVLSHGKPIAVTFRLGLGEGRLTATTLAGALESPYTDREAALHAGSGDHTLYYDATDKKVVWVLDYVDPGTETAPDVSHSIGSRYPDLAPTEIRVKITREDGAFQLNTSNAEDSHYDSRTGDGTYLITNLRHLSNVRYEAENPAGQEAKFRQLGNLDLSEIKNFAPLNWISSGAGFDKSASFKGSYLATESETQGFLLENLTIRSEDGDGAPLGLFGRAEDATLQGLALWNATITSLSGGSVGALCGEAVDSEIRLSMAWADVTADNRNGTHPTYAGGLVGHLEGGSIALSYNGGYYNAAAPGTTSRGQVRVTGTYGSAATVAAGGLVGYLEDAAISASYNNARVNVESVTYYESGEGTPEFLSLDPVFYDSFQHGDPENTSFGGIAGRSEGGSLKNVYATNYVAAYETQDKTKKSLSGAILGRADDETVWSNAYALAGSAAQTSGDGRTIGAFLSKENLSEMPFGGAVLQRVGGSYEGRGLPSADAAQPENYPYPQLKNNAHRSPWEDILSQSGPSAILQYVQVDQGVNLFGEHYRLYTVETRSSFLDYRQTDMTATLTWDTAKLTLDNDKGLPLGEIVETEGSMATVVLDLKNNARYTIRFFEQEMNLAGDLSEEPVSFVFQVEKPAGASFGNYVDVYPKAATP